MAALRVLAQRLPITATAFAARRTPALARFNSTSSASPAAQVVEMARAAEKPSPAEASVPAMWVLCGALAVIAFNRAENKEDHVEKLLIV